jgi:hypothetical protein
MRCKRQLNGHACTRLRAYADVCWSMVQRKPHALQEAASVRGAYLCRQLVALRATSIRQRMLSDACMRVHFVPATCSTEGY